MDLSSAGGCDNAFSFCGVRNSRYPDRKAMGYPFDRLPRAGVGILSQFLTPNMRTQDVQIRFTDRIINGPTVTATQTTPNQQTAQQPTSTRPAATPTPSRTQPSRRN